MQKSARSGAKNFNDTLRCKLQHAQMQIRQHTPVRESARSGAKYFIDALRCKLDSTFSYELVSTLRCESQPAQEPKIHDTLSVN